MSTLALEGDPAPAGLGHYQSIGNAVDLSSAGHVGFRATLDSSPGAGGAFVRDPDGAYSYTLAGDPCPPLLIGSAYSSLIDAPDVAADGSRVFLARGDDDASPMAWVLESEGAAVVLARAGDPIPGVPGATWDWSSSVYEIDDLGRVVLVTRFDDASGPPDAYGLFRFASGGVATLVRSGDPVPDSGGEVFGELEGSRARSANEAGDVVFRGRLAGSLRRGVFRYEGDGGAVTTVALELAPSPLPGRVYTFPSLPFHAINGAGEVAFVATLEDQNLDGAEAIVLSTDAGTAAVLVEGDPAPAGDGFVFTSFASLALADDGSIAFLAAAEDGTTSRYGAYLLRGGTVSPLAVQGEAAPDSGGALFDNFVPFGVRINGRGEITFFATLADGRSGVFLAREVDAVPVAGALPHALLALALAAAGSRLALCTAPRRSPR